MEGNEVGGMKMMGVVDVMGMGKIFWDGRDVRGKGVRRGC